MISSRARFAIHGLSFLARNGAEGPTSFAALFDYLQGWSGRLVLSESYVSKIFQDLSRGGLVRAVKGRSGGYRLAHPPAEVSMLDIVRLLDGLPANDCCLLADGCCPRKGLCGVVSVVEEAQQAFFLVLARETLADTARKMPLPASNRSKGPARSPAKSPARHPALRSTRPPARSRKP
jgi:Rrf2 family nitric oxide-sensitive transcriptional repressor